MKRILLLSLLITGLDTFAGDQLHGEEREKFLEHVRQLEIVENNPDWFSSEAGLLHAKARHSVAIREAWISVGNRMYGGGSATFFKGRDVPHLLSHCERCGFYLKAEIIANKYTMSGDEIKELQDWEAEAVKLGYQELKQDSEPKNSKGYLRALADKELYVPAHCIEAWHARDLQETLVPSAEIEPLANLTEYDPTSDNSKLQALLIALAGRSPSITIASLD